MKKATICSVFCLALCAVASMASAQVNSSQSYVQGYIKSDGNYVPSHYKTNPNYTNRDNFTTKPNVNPYTSKPGYIEPDTRSLYNQSSSYNNIYSTPSSTYSTPSNSYRQTEIKTIYTGPNGGQYYINSKGNKTYVKP